MKKKKTTSRKTNNDKKMKEGLKFAQDLYGTKDIIVKKKRISKWIIDRIEKNDKVNLKKRPTFFVVEMKNKKSNKIPIPKKFRDRQARTMIKFDTNKDGIYYDGAVIVMPKPVYDDEILKDSLLVHEITEIASTQSIMSDLGENGYPHYWAMKAERKYLKDKHTTMKTQNKRADKLLEDVTKWK